MKKNEQKHQAQKQPEQKQQPPQIPTVEIGLRIPLQEAELLADSLRKLSDSLLLASNRERIRLQQQHLILPTGQPGKKG